MKAKVVTNKCNLSSGKYYVIVVEKDNFSFTLKMPSGQYERLSVNLGAELDDENYLKSHESPQILELLQEICDKINKE